MPIVIIRNVRYNIFVRFFLERKLLMKTNLKYLRKKKRMTQKQFSEFIGISQSSLSEIETETHGTTIKTLSKIAGALGIHWTKLIPGEKDKSGNMS